MSTLTTTAAMVSAAEDAYDVACADEAVAHTKHLRERTPESEARWLVASAARFYAAAVMLSVMADEHHDSAMSA